MTDAAIVVGTVDNPPGTAKAPPIALLLPLLHLALAGFSLLIDLGIRILLVVAYPLCAIWSIANALLLPITVIVKIALDILLFTPFSIVSLIAVALYPVYVFCAVACIFGTIIGMFGHYISITILGVLARSKCFIQSPSTPPTAHQPGPQVALRKRKRKSVRLQ